MKTNGKPLRFAALIRVSTEKQASKGESLKTQESQIEQAVEAVGGTISKRYAGQEHATSGWEREQLDKLLADAQKARKPFDAVMVADPSRWSRDNVASETGLTILRDNGIRFFVLGAEHNLYEPQALLILAMNSVFGAFQARTQNQKSTLNRIERAKRGYPTGGKLPYGRRWDKAKCEWSIDPEKLATIEDVTARFLAGESLKNLAKEMGMNHSNLVKVLRERCGDTWTQKFNVPDLNIDERIEIKIPRLLPDSTIKKIHIKLKANRTYVQSGGRLKNDFLLSGFIRCAGCGYVMFGQENHNGHLYYRHAHKDRTKDCPFTNPRPWVRADLIEQAVLRDLFELRGNVSVIEKAIASANPDADGVTKKRARIETELGKIDKARGNVLKLIERDAIEFEQAEKKLLELKDRESKLHTQVDSLASIPDEKALKQFVETIGNDILLLDDEGNTYVGGNDVGSFLALMKPENRDQRRALIESTFSAPLPDGTPASVYVTPSPETEGKRRKTFQYSIRGIFGETEGVTLNAKRSLRQVLPGSRSPARCVPRCS